jgi:hypothetical protein
MSDELVTQRDLAAAGLGEEDVLRLCQGATRYIALDGSFCWRSEDLAPPFGRKEREE